MDENIHVSCRVRRGSPACITTHGRIVETVVDYNTLTPATFEFDHVFGPDATQADVFEQAARRIVDGVVDGVNGTLFAYGQTGSGKTHTIVGPSEQQNICDISAEDRGIIPRAVEHIFECLNVKQRQAHEDTFLWKVSVSYVQLYNENWYDLLGARHKVTLRANNLTATKYDCTSHAEALIILEEGWRNRIIAETKMNRQSSRSHCLFIMELVIERVQDELVEQFLSKLNIVDLAGSERLSYTGIDTTSSLFKETVAINQSLLVLSKVIRELSQGKNAPFRESQLTLFLRDSLGGNSRAGLIVAVYAQKEYAINTNSTLMFALQCRKIKNSCTVNVKVRGESIAALQKKLDDVNVQLHTKLIEIRKAVEEKYRPVELECKALREENIRLRTSVEEMNASQTLREESANVKTPRRSVARASRRRTLFVSGEEVRRSVSIVEVTDKENDDNSSLPKHVQYAQQTLYEDLADDPDIVINRMRQLLEQRDVNLSDLQSHIAALEAELTCIKKDVEKRNIQNSIEQNEFLRHSEELLNKNKDAEQQIKALNSDLLGLRAEAEERQNQIKDLESEKMTANIEAQEAQRIIVELRKINSTLSDENRLIRSRFAIMQQDLQQAQGEAMHFKEKCRCLDEEYAEELHLRNTTLEQLKVRLEESVANIEEQLNQRRLVEEQLRREQQHNEEYSQRLLLAEERVKELVEVASTAKIQQARQPQQEQTKTAEFVSRLSQALLLANKRLKNAQLATIRVPDFDET